MADGEGVNTQCDDGSGEGKPCAEFRMELRDSLPGGRAVIAVEQEGEFVWLASREHVSEQARDEFMEQITHIVKERWWVQNWPGK
jgi:hypothetical protein